MKILGLIVIAVVSSAPAIAGDHQIITRYFGMIKHYGDPMPTHKAIQQISPNDGIILEVQQDLTQRSLHHVGLENRSTVSGNLFHTFNSYSNLRFMNPLNRQPIISANIQFQDHDVSIPDTFDGVIDFNGASGESFTEEAIQYSCIIDTPASNPDLIEMLTGDGVVNLPIRSKTNFEFSDTNANNVVNSHMDVSFRWVMKVTILQ